MIVEGLCNLPAREEDLTGLVRLNRELVARADGVDSPRIGFTIRWKCITSGNARGEFH